MNISAIRLLAAQLLMFGATFALAQGLLTPPGAPAPTMKTLEQIEPRVPINATTAPGDADYHHIIAQPGSYYLTGNLEVTRKHGIGVRAEGVTLDLSGFEVRRAADGGGAGIEVDTTSHRCTIKNGSIKGFEVGLHCLSARGGRCLHLSVSGCTDAGLLAGEGWQLDGCTAHDNSGTGIAAGIGSTFTNCAATANSGDGNGAIEANENSTLINCTAANNTTTHGILAATGSTLTNCAAARNTGVYAIFVGNGCTLTNCTATNNTGTSGIFTGPGCTLINCIAYSNEVFRGIEVFRGCTLKNCASRSNRGPATITGGIDAGQGCTLIGCAATSNSNTNDTASPSTGFGIRISADSTVRDCTVDDNKGDGIQATGSNSHLAGNTATGNGGGAGANIHVLSSATGCRVDGNHCATGNVGIWVEGACNLVVRNSVHNTASLALHPRAGQPHRGHRH